MELKSFLRDVTALTGIPGYEQPVARFVAETFEKLADDVRVDAMGNVVARLGLTGPRVMISAHMDEIGMVVSAVEDDGCLRLARAGGVDPRILPGMEVSVLTREGPLFGVVGAKPPHLLTEAERKKALEMTDMFVDVGYPAAAVNEKVRIGDPVVMRAPMTELANERVAGKTMDDRAGVAAMVACAEHLNRMHTPAQVFFVASTQEEVGSRGARTSAYALDPDMGIAVDVTHATSPGTGPAEAFPADKVCVATGPNIHKALLKILRDTAKKNHVDLSIEVAAGETGTDASVMQLAREGVPCVLISLPLKYMHTAVETLSLDVVRETGRLMAAFIDDAARGWEEIKWH